LKKLLDALTDLRLVVQQTLQNFNERFNFKLPSLS